MLVWIFLSKMVKIAPHFYDHPLDILWIPAYLVFAYYHSFIKFYCGMTFYNHSWGGRNLAAVTDASTQNLAKKELEEARPNLDRGITGLYSDTPTPRPSFSSRLSSFTNSFRTRQNSMVSSSSTPRSSFSARQSSFRARQTSMLSDDGYFGNSPAEVFSEPDPLPLSDIANRLRDSVPAARGDKNKWE